LPLNEVAKVANYSPYHFHRIFKSETGQTPNYYINRKRIELAAAVLLCEIRITISELALRYHFTSHSSFTRAFKKFYGLSPSEF